MKHILLYLSIVISLVGCGGSTNNPLNHDSVDEGSEKLTVEKENEYLKLINKARGQEQSCGEYGIYPAVAALKWSTELYNASAEHSKDMAEQNFHKHIGSGKETDITASKLHPGKGSTFDERIKSNNYNLTTGAENIAAGYSSTEEVIKGWIKSDGHCANLMNPNYEDVGMALYKKDGTDYKYYWTQNFGAK
jgi:uncharacterized protein YkwD